MSINKANIAQIQKYLKGELDAKAMHALEKQAQDDPFLMDAIEGYQNTGTDQQANFDDVKERFAKRTQTNNARPVMLWRVLPIAASLLIALTIGWLCFKPSTDHELSKYSKIALPPSYSNAAKVNGQATSANTAATDNNITGIITDPTGHSLAGVKVGIKGTRLNALTDTNGRFSLAAAPSVKGILNVAYSGYDAKQVRLNGNNNLKVTLNESTNELATVSVTAYVEDDKPANKTHPAIGWKAFRDYLRKNAFVETGETGLVKLAFTVSADGIINGIRVTHGNNDEMNQKAIDLVLNGPVWKGINNSEMRLKIQFRKAKDS